MQIDSMQIYNVTQNWRQTVISPDTVVEFPVLTGIPDVEKPQVIQIAPNPSNGSAQVSFFHQDTEMYMCGWWICREGSAPNIARFCQKGITR